MSVCTWDNCFRQTKEVHGAELKSYLRLVTIAWGFGAAFCGAIGGTALPELSKQLGAPQFFFGLLGAAPFLGWVLQLPISWLVEKTGKRKWLFIWPVAIHRILFLVVAAIPFVLPSEWRNVRLCALIATLALSWILGGAGGPTWMGWMADLIPSRVRGRYWAFRRRVGLITTMVAALLAGWFIDYSSGTRLGTQGGIAVVFAIAAVLGTIDVLLFIFIPEIPKKVSQAATTWKALVFSPLKDCSFRQLMAYWFLLNFANAGLISTFFQRNLREIVQMQNAWVNFVLVVSPCIGWYLAVKWWGVARDRWGNRPILVISSAAVVINPLIWCLIRPEWAWIGLLVPIYGGMMWSGIDMALSAAMLSFAEGGKTSSYQALAAIITGLGGFAGSLVAGAIGEALAGWQVQVGPLTFVSYHLLFVMGAGLQIATVPLALRIHEPSARATREVLRVLYENAAQLTRVLVYMPRRAVSLPVVVAERRDGSNGRQVAAGNGYPVSVYHGVGRIYSRYQYTRGSVSSGNGMRPSNYNDYVMQLIEEASKELADHAQMRKAAARAEHAGSKV